mmetsp:Transcript_63545/g.73895  ORF Transcript_63545/g.73895 Transcript_63545/m.73895 type:complete len:408 (-) Transcript_63545:185-1408(-)
MSEFHKKMFKKGGKPPVDPNALESNTIEEEEFEETKDSFKSPMDRMSGFGSGPIRPTQSFSEPGQEGTITFPKKIGTGGFKVGIDFNPSSWEEYWDKMEYLEDGTSVFIAGTKDPIFLCLHGAGHSAQSFACYAGQIKKFATAIAFDFRGHGLSKFESDPDNLSGETLVEDTLKIFDWVHKKYPESTIIVTGHSMGGSIATKATEIALQNKESTLAKRIQGMLIIDVVEGTAIEALPFMESIVKSRPKSFPSLDKAIHWAYKTGVVKNRTSAKVSIPYQLVENKISDEKSEWVWKVDLMASEKYWMGWFKGLTKSFLNVSVPKVLLLAGAERMDKELTIAQMQGRFRLKVVYDVGHSVQEDNFVETAKISYELVKGFRIPINQADVDRLEAEGVGKFHAGLPDVKFG